MLPPRKEAGRQTALLARLRRNPRLHVPAALMHAAGLTTADLTRMRAGTWKPSVPPKTPLQTAADSLAKYVAKPRPSQVETADAVRIAAQAIILLATPPN